MGGQYWRENFPQAREISAGASDDRDTNLWPIFLGPFTGQNVFSRVGLEQGDLTRPVTREHLPTRPDPAHGFSITS